MFIVRGMRCRLMIQIKSASWNRERIIFGCVNFSKTFHWFHISNCFRIWWERCKTILKSMYWFLNTNKKSFTRKSHFAIVVIPSVKNYILRTRFKKCVYFAGRCPNWKPYCHPGTRGSTPWRKSTPTWRHCWPSEAGTLVQLPSPRWCPLLRVVRISLTTPWTTSSLVALTDWIWTGNILPTAEVRLKIRTGSPFWSRYDGQMTATSCSLLTLNEAIFLFVCMSHVITFISSRAKYVNG